MLELWRAFGLKAKPCLKQKHASKGKAEAHIRALIRSGYAVKPELLVAYACDKQPCKAGGFYHVGHKPE